MADIIGQETWTADGIDYVIKVTEPGATVTENAIKIISPVTHRKGDPNAEPLAPILISQVDFTIKDTGKLFQTAIEGKEIGDIVLEFTADGSTLFKGYVVPEYQRSLVYMDNPEYTVTAYDGIEGLKGFTYDKKGEKNLRGIIFDIQDKIGLDLTTNYVFEWSHTGADAATRPAERLQIRTEQLLGDETSTYYDALALVCRFFGAQFFQEDGEWWFMQRELRGASMDIYPVSYLGATGTMTSDSFLYAATHDNLHREDSYFSRHPAVARVVSKHTYPNYLIKNPDWTEGSKYWDSSGDDSAGGNGGRQITTNDGYLAQTLGTTFIIASGSRDQLSITYSAWVGVDGAATGSHAMAYMEVKALVSDGTAYYLTTGGAWSGTQQYVTETFDFGTFSGSTYNFVASHLTPIMPDEPIQITVTLYFDQDASGTATDLDYIEFGPVKVRHIKPDEADDIFRAEEFVATEETGGPGQNQEDEFFIGDTDNDTFFGAGVFSYYDGSDWLPSYSWAPSAERLHEKRAASISSQLGTRLEAYEFSHAYGEDIKLYNGINYQPPTATSTKVFIPTYVEKTYRRNAKLKTRTSSKELAGVTYPPAPTVVYYARPTAYRIVTIADSTPWTSAAFNTPVLGREVDYIKADVPNGYLWGLEYSTTTVSSKWLTRRDITDGSLIDTPVDWDADTYTCFGFAVHRATQRIYTCEDEVSGTAARVRVYQYDGTLVDTLYTSAAAEVSNPAVDPSGTYLYFRAKKTGIGPFDQLHRITLADGTDTTIATSFTYGQSSGVSQDVSLVDPDEALIFLNAVTQITKFPYPSAGSETLITTNGATNALGIDRFNKLLYFVGATSNYKISRIEYDGTGETEVMSDGSSTANIIKTLDLGYD